MPRLHLCTSIAGRDGGGSNANRPGTGMVVVWLPFRPALASPVPALRHRTGRRTLRKQGSISGGGGVRTGAENLDMEMDNNHGHLLCCANI